MNDLKNIQQRVRTLFHRYHIVMFIVLLTISLSIAVLLLSKIVDKAGGTESEVPLTNSSRFDEETIERINQLKTSDEPSTPLDFSKGRISPFNE